MFKGIQMFRVSQSFADRNIQNAKKSMTTSICRIYKPNEKEGKEKKAMKET